ncbi:hypothetical protein ZWY2020_038713 [Hordeum vulgare]|nr:hypothetical protein ZWY2020_038713 [Hordeum vulgare]
MEFPRRGPATGDGRRFPDPPPHGEEEPMTVMRNALLSQLHMDHLRQEIIVSELAKMERANALRAGVATADAGQSKPCPFSAEQLMALRAATPIPLLGLAAADAGRYGLLPFSAEQPMALRASACEQQTTRMPSQSVVAADAGQSTTCPFSAEQPMALRASACSQQDTRMPLHSVVAADAGQSMPCPFSAEQLMALHAAPSSHQDTQMALHGVAAADAGPSKLWPLSVEQLMALRAAADSHHATPMPMYGEAATDAGRSKPWSFSAEQPMSLPRPVATRTCRCQCTAWLPQMLDGLNHGHSVLSSPCRLAAAGSHHNMPMPMYGAAAADAGRSKPWSFSAEQPMPLLAVAGSHENTPMSLHGVAAADAGPSKLSPFSVQQLMALCAPAGGNQATPMPLHGANAADAGWSKPLPFSAEQPMTVHAAAAGHQVIPMPLHGAAAADAGRSNPCPSSADQLMSQQNAKFDEHKPPDSNKAVPQSKTSLAEKLELTGINIPVKKPKPLMKWNCTVCQVQATCEKNLQMHYAGQKHLANVAMLDPVTKPTDQKAKAAAAEPSLGTEQKKTSSINWSCSTCQACGTSKSTFDAHLQGKRHQQNIAEASVKGDGDGDGNGAPKNATAGEAKSDGVTMPNHSKKPSSVWSCSICQTTCTCETDLKNHLSGTRHREKVQSLLEESKNMARNPETNLKKNNAPQMVKNKGPHPAWNCTMCEAKCYSKSQFENHCSGSRHQQKIEAIIGKCETAKPSSMRTANEPSSDGSSGRNASSEKAEKKATLYFCEVCNLLCSSSETLLSHRYGKKHREKLSAGK